MYSSDSTATLEHMLATRLSTSDLPLYMGPCIIKAEKSEEDTPFYNRQTGIPYDSLLQLSQVSRALFSATKESIGRLRKMNITRMVYGYRHEKPLLRIYSEWSMDYLEPREIFIPNTKRTQWLISSEYVRLVPPSKKKILMFITRDKKGKKRRTLTLLSLFFPCEQ